MTDKERLLSELAELNEGAVHEFLLKEREDLIKTWTASGDEKADLILKGEKRALDRLIREIEEAPEQIRRARELRPNMSRAF